MAKRNAKKQATREDIESEDPVCRELSTLLDRADLLGMTAGSDYEPSEDPQTPARGYETRLTYLSTLLEELITFRVDVLLDEATKTVRGLTSTPPQPTESEEESDGDASNETE